MRVVVLRVFADHVFEVAAANNQQSVEALAPNASDPASACARAFGAWIGALITRMPSERKPAARKAAMAARVEIDPAPPPQPEGISPRHKPAAVKQINLNIPRPGSLLHDSFAVRFTFGAAFGATPEPTIPQLLRGSRPPCGARSPSRATVAWAAPVAVSVGSATPQQRR